jgi:hypothetical protein
MAIDLTKLEHEVMQMLLGGDHATLEILRKQLALCTAASRESTGCGFFTTFSIPTTASRLPDNDSFCFGDVSANIPCLKNGAGFVLWIRNGVLHVLEGYTYDEPWPNQTDEFTLQYNNSQRDIKKW